jgi:hypothetical protein
MARIFDVDYNLLKTEGDEDEHSIAKIFKDIEDVKEELRI